MRWLSTRALGVALVLFAVIGALGAVDIIHGDGDAELVDVLATIVLTILAAGTVAVLVGVARALRASDEARAELRMRVSQQEAVARLGQLALTHVETDDLLREAVDAVRTELRAELTSVLEAVDGAGFVTRVSAGWPENATPLPVPAGRGSQGGYTIDAQAPVIMHDARAETRFAISPSSIAAGVVSGLSVPIGSNGGTFGVLGVHTRERRAFSEDDVAFVAAVANVIANALRRQRAEDDAETTHRVLDAVITGTTDDVFVKDLDGRFVALNDRVAETFGRPRAEIVGRLLEEVVPPEIAAQMRATDELVLERGTVDTFEETIAFGGSERVLLTTKGPYRSRDGSVLGTFGIAHDITERKVQERALAHSEERFRLAQEGARMGTWDVDLTTGAATWSNGLRQLFGVGPEAPTGFADFVALIHPDDRDAVAQRVAEAETAAKEFEIECRILRPDGGVRWTLGRSSLVRDDDGRPVRMLGVSVDITERKRVEEELGRSEETLRLAQAASGIAAWDWDFESGELHWTPGVYEIFGVDPSEYEPSYEAMMECLHPDDAAGLDAEVQRTLASGSSFYEYASRVVQPSGGIRFVVNRGTIIRDGEGKPTRMLGITLDETERKQVEARLRQAEKLEAVGRLAGGIAHDFNNLLVAIRGYAEFALDELEPGTPVAENVAGVISAADNSAALTKQLLAFARRQVLMPTVLDLNDVVGDTAGLLHRLLGDHVELVLRLASPPVVVLADRGQLEQVITNLAVNARDAMPDGGTVTIGVAASTGHGGDHVGLLTVSDEGAGIDPATAAHIFDPFFSTKGEHGTGLGLATVDGIVTQSGGTISVSSPPGHGATFTVALPITQAELPRAVDGRNTARDADGSETILVVEDDPAVRQIVSTMLEERGYEIVAAADGEDAVGRFRDCGRPMPLVVSDLMMRGIDGRETIDRIRELAPATKVLFMSGYTDDPSMLRCDVTAETGFIQKPFGGDELACRVRDLLDQVT
jgi:two-component system, cell cycle sensor histidine kinase and response regulator CckA